MWYDINTTLSHNAFINIVYGGRGRGKTYSAKLKGLNNYLKKGEKFAYVRRYQDELDLVKKGLFNDINKDTGYNVYFEQNTYKLDNDIIGYAIDLSTSHKLKSASYPDTNLIIFDEFVVDNSTNIHYLRNEVRKFLDLVETIGRLRSNIKVVMFGNSLSIINPYTRYWDLTPSGEISKFKNGLILLHILPDDPEFVEAKLNTPFGQLINDSDYGSMAINNQFLLDSLDFICKKPGNAKYIYSFEIFGTKYGVWSDSGAALYYVDNKPDPYGIINYAITLDDHSINKVMLFASNSGPFMRFLTSFKLGRVRFADLKCKAATIEAFKMVGKL